MYFDSHTHYDDERFDEDRKQLLEELPLRGVSYVVNAAASMKSAHTSVQLADEYEYIYATVGVHPHEVESMTDKDIEILRNLAKHPKVVAIGEIGLDYYYDFSPRELQREWFSAQLGLAKELNLPVVIHSREACQQTFDMIIESEINQGVIHCFSGSKELAKEYVKRGFYIGIGGAITFKNARKTLEVVQDIPLDRILIETDCPYLTPVPHRGKRNDSSYLVHVVDKIAEIKGLSTEEVSKVTRDNAKKLFKII